MTPSPQDLRIAPNQNRVRVLFSGHLLAESTRALTVHEPGHAPVQYLPREDIEMSVLTRTDRHTYCPRKGEASYFTIARDGVIAENFAWSYEHPLEGAERIAGFLAFYPDQAILEEAPAVS